MKKSYNVLKTTMFCFLAFAAGNHATAQTCVTPTVTSISNDGPGCPGQIINLHAEGNIGGTSAGFTRMAGIGGNFGNQEFNVMFASGDRPGQITRMKEAEFNALAAGGAAALRANYDVLLFTWASDPGLNAPWSLIEGYLALGGSVFWEDEVNLSDLSAGIQGVNGGTTGGCAYDLVVPPPFPVLVSNGVTGCFANDHLYLTSWPSWMQAYITASGRNLAIAGIHPTGGGRLIIQGPDQDFHAVRNGSGSDGNQYQFMLNQMDFLTAGQGGFSWTGPNGFTATGANAAVTLSPTSAGVYTATLTNTTGGGCSASGTTTVVLNAIPNIYDMTGGGNYCAGASGSSVGLSSSESGITYQLKLNGTSTGVTMTGTGAALDFGPQTALGVYTVSATGTVCSVDMNGDATVTTNKTAVITAGGPTTFCPETGVTLTAGLSSEPFTSGSVSTYLWNTGATTGSVFVDQSATTSVDITLDNGCSTTATTTTTAYVTTVDAGTDATICPGSSTQLAAAGTPYSSGGGTYNLCIYDALGGNNDCDQSNGNLCSDGYENFGSSSSHTGTLTTTGSVTPQTLDVMVYYTNCSGNIDFTFKLNGNVIHTATDGSPSCTCVDATYGTYPLNFSIPLTSFASYWSNSGTNTITVETSGGNIFIAAQKATITASTSSYSWTPSTGLSDAGIENPVASPSATTNYTVTFTSGYGCIATDDVTVSLSDATLIADATTLASVTGECSASVTTTPTATNCRGTFNGTTSDALTYNTQGTHTITWNYSDGHGNTATQTQTVIVDDITAPVADVATLATVTGECSATVTSAPTATDNCGATITGTTSAPLTYTAQGTYSITWTYDDGNGNTSTQMQSVVVDDNTNPTITAPANVTVNNYCTAAPADLGTPATGDNCVVASVTNDAPSLFPVGTTTVTWTVTDIAGNTATATQTVTVNTGTVSLSATTTNVSCNEGSNGAIDLTVSGGTTAYSYNWDGGVTTQDRTGLSAGTYTVNVTDAHSCTATASYTITEPTVLTSSSSVSPLYPFVGQEVQTIYLGYTPSSAQSMTVNASASGGTSPYTYSWQRSGCNNTTLATISGTTASQTFSPNSTYICASTGDNIYQYVVTITDANGCTTTQQKNLNVVDPFSGNKIKICHIPPGEPYNPQLITVAAAAVPAHLAHGDALGNCFTFAGRYTNEEEEPTLAVIAEELHFHVYPNPNNGSFTVDVPEQGSTQIVITDVAGKVVYKQDLKDNTEQKLQFNLNNEAKGLYFIRLNVNGQFYQSKVSVQ